MLLTRSLTRRLLTTLALAATSACSSRDATASAASQQSDGRATEVRTAIAGRTTIHPTLLLSGAIAPSQTVALSNSMNEPAQSVSVEEGDRVHAGQTLAQLQVDDLQANLQAALRTARANEARVSENNFTANVTLGQAPEQVGQAKAQVSQAEQTLREAQINLKRDKQLADQGYLPSQNVDEQAVVVGNDAQAVRSAQATLRSAVVSEQQNGTPQHGLQASTIAESEQTAAAQYATADQLRRQISRATIVSPIDGVVINRNLNPGEYPSGRQIFTLEGNDSVFAILTASAVQAYQIHAGNLAQIERAGMSGQRFFGRVAAVLDAATPGSTNFTVKISVPNTQHELRAGTPIRAVVDLGGFSGAAVPASAFVDDSRTRIQTVVDGRARSVPVVERATDGVTSIVSGIAPGTRVIRDGGTSIDNGAPVRPVR